MTTNFGGVVVVPLQGAIVVCYGWGAEGDDQFWWSGRGAIAGCHCSVLWLRGRVTTNFGGVDVVPLLGAIVVCYGGGGGLRPTLGEWCHCWVPLQLGGGEGDDQLWGSGRGAIAGCPYAAIASRQTALNFLQTLHCSLR